MATMADRDPFKAFDEKAFREFQASKQVMKAADFGRVIGDAMWENEPDLEFLVYDKQWYIEICASDRYLLVLGNQNWLTGPDISLEDLERKLFDYSLES